MHAAEMRVGDYVICTGETRYAFPVEKGSVVNINIRSDKPFRLFIVSSVHGRVCVGPANDGDLSFEGRFRVVEGERFDVHCQKSATVGVVLKADPGRRLADQVDPVPVEIPIPMELTMEQKIALEVERRLASGQEKPSGLEYLDQDDVDWDDWSPFMDEEYPEEQTPPSNGEQKTEPAKSTSGDVQPKAAEQFGEAGHVDEPANTE